MLACTGDSHAPWAQSVCMSTPSELPLESPWPSRTLARRNIETGTLHGRGASSGVVAAVAVTVVARVQLMRPPTRNCRCRCRRCCVAAIIVMMRAGRHFSPPPLQTWFAAAHAWSPRSPAPFGGLPHQGYVCRSPGACFGAGWGAKAAPRVPQAITCLESRTVCQQCYHNP